METLSNMSKVVDALSVKANNLALDKPKKEDKEEDKDKKDKKKDGKEGKDDKEKKAKDK